MSCHILHYIPGTQKAFSILFDIFCYCISGGFSITGTPSEGISSKVIFLTMKTERNLEEIICLICQESDKKPKINRKVKTQGR